MKRLSLRFFIFAIFFVIFVTFAFLLVYTKVLPTKYIARASVAVKKEDTSQYNKLVLSHHLAETLENIYDSDEIVERAYLMLGQEIPMEEIKKGVKVVKKPKTMIIKVDAINRSKEKAVVISEAYVEAMKEDNLAKEMEMDIFILGPIEVSIYRENLWIVTLIGFACGLVLAVLIWYIRYVLSKKMASISNLKSKGYIVLGQAK